MIDITTLVLVGLGCFAAGHFASLVTQVIYKKAFLAFVTQEQEKAQEALDLRLAEVTAKIQEQVATANAQVTALYQQAVADDQARKGVVVPPSLN